MLINIMSAKSILFCFIFGIKQDLFEKKRNDDKNK